MTFHTNGVPRLLSSFLHSTFLVRFTRVLTFYFKNDQAYEKVRGMHMKARGDKEGSTLASSPHSLVTECLTDLIRLASSKPQQPSCLRSSQLWGHRCSCIFTRVLAIWAQVLIPAQQALLPTRPLSPQSPSAAFKCKWHTSHYASLKKEEICPMYITSIFICSKAENNSQWAPVAS